MNKTRASQLFFVVLQCIAFSFIYSQAQAGGYQNSLQSVEGMGRAFAGEVADSSVLSTTRNPANVMLLDRMELSNSFMATYVNYDIDTEKNPFSQLPDANSILADPIGFFLNPNDARYKYKPRLDQDLDDTGTKIVIPAVGFGHNMGKWGYGITASSHFAYEFESDEVYSVGATFGDLYIKTAHITGNLAYRINDQFSIGLGLSVIPGWFKAERNAGELAFIVDDIGNLVDGIPLINDVFNDIAGGLRSPNANVAKFKGNDVTWGWSLGLTWEPSPYDRFGLVYNARSRLETEGHYESDLPEELNLFGPLLNGNIPGFIDQLNGNGELLFPEPTGGKRIKAQVDVDLPMFIEAGGWHKIRPDWELFYSVRWTNWTKGFDGITIEAKDGSGRGAIFPVEVSDSIKFSVGMAHQINPTWEVRAGFAIDESFIPDERDMLLNAPDSRRWWFNGGLTYNHDETTSIDLGLGFIYFEEDEVDEPEDLFERVEERTPLLNRVLGVNDLNVKADIDAWIALAGIQFNKKF